MRTATLKPVFVRFVPNVSINELLPAPGMPVIPIRIEVILFVNSFVNNIWDWTWSSIFSL